MSAMTPGAIGVTYGMAVHGITGTPVRVEADCGPGLPGLAIVGWGDTAVSEARDRIRTAARNSVFPWPRSKVVVSLSPASLPKAGSGYDLALACAILSCGSVSSLTCGDRLQQTILLGELGLDGSVRPVRGMLPALMSAAEHGFSTAVVPASQAAEAALVPGIDVYVAAHLSEVVQWLCDERPLACPDNSTANPATGDDPQASPGIDTTGVDMRDIVGQDTARRALEVAAAGGHHMLLVGPPGSGKTMLAARLPTILPPLSPTQQLTVAAIRSVSGHTASHNIATYTGTTGEEATITLPRGRPFVEPHPGISVAGLLGGGSGMPQPGAISLAHLGVLLLDEAAEIRSGVLDSLRIPLEQGQIRLTRGRHEATYPARFQLILAMNPCRCAAATAHLCRCDSRTRARYRSAISAPLRDRLHLHIATQPHPTVDNASASGECSAIIRSRVCEARERAYQRWQQWGLDENIETNSDVPGTVLRRWLSNRPVLRSFLMTTFEHGNLSQRGIDRSLRVAWSLADLAGREEPHMDDLAEAIELHDAGGH